MNQDHHQTMLRRARDLRKNMTPWERKLWYTFLKHYPIHIYRQRVMGTYVVDFYCDQAKLAIELDGSQHFTDTERAHDLARTEYLNNLGVEVLRVPNVDVDRHFVEVCEQIDRRVQQRIAEMG